MNKHIINLYWSATYIGIFVSLFFWSEAIFISMLMVAIHGLHMHLKTKRFHSFPMQVRIYFLMLLILGLAPGMFWIHWVQFAGVTSYFVFDYCPLARILSLMPWNRDKPLSWSLFKTAVFSRPVNGSILELTAPVLAQQLQG